MTVKVMAFDIPEDRHAKPQLIGELHDEGAVELVLCRLHEQREAENARLEAHVSALNRDRSSSGRMQ